uniref:hypothetical protein n=1 Tax=Acetatifactor sp. TaxID=1872090 RepID=UPI004056BE6F
MKKLVCILLCSLFLVGCGQDATGSDNDQTANAADTVADAAGDMASTQEDVMVEEVSEDAVEESEVAEDDGMMDYTVYTGEIVSVAEDGLTWVALDAEQVIPVETMEIVLSDGTAFCVPAENIPASIKDYENAVSNGSVQFNEPERYKDYIQQIFVSFPNADWSAYFFLDNETNEDTVDAYTLPVTYMQTTFNDPITINGFAFNKSTFTITDLVAAWGNPILAQVDTREGVVEEVEYYWRYLDGYVEVDVEEDKLYGFYLYQWDTYTEEDNYMSMEIPKYGE